MTYVQRGRRLASLFASNAAGTVVSQLVALLVIPIQLQFLGAEQFGLLVLFNSFVAAGSLTDLGIGPTVVRFVARTERHPKALAHVFASAFTVILMLSAVVAMLGMAAAWGYEAIRAQSQIAGSLYPHQLAALIVFTVGVSMLSGLGLNVLRGLRQYRHFALAESAVRLVIPLAGTTAAVLTGDAGATLIASSAGMTVTTAVLLGIVAHRIHARTWLTTNLRYFKRKMFHFGRWVWVQALFGFLGAQADRFIVAATMSLSVLAAYAIAMSVANAVLAGLTAGSGFLMPEVVNRLNDKTWLERAYRRYTLLFSAVSAAGILFALPLITPVLTLWVKADMTQQVLPVLLPIMWTISSSATSIPGTQIMNAMGYTRFGAFLGIANNSVLLLALLVAGAWAGLYGVIAAKLLAVPIGFVARAVTAHHVFKMPRPIFEAFKMVWPTVLGAAIVLPLSWKLLIG